MLLQDCIQKTKSFKTQSGCKRLVNLGLVAKYIFLAVQDLAAKKLLKSSYQVLSLMEGVFSNIYFDFSFFLEVSSTLQQCQQLKQSALSSCI